MTFRTHNPPKSLSVGAILLGAWLIVTSYGVFSPAQAHEALPAYEGAKTCMPCHPGKAEEVHASVHYQWQGATPGVPNLGGKIAGKWGSTNDFCTYPNINFLFQSTNTAGAQVVVGCGACHVGRGLPPEPTPTTAQLENIDCLICHSDLYQRVGAMVNGVPALVTAPTVDIAAATAAIQSPPSKNTCLSRCHVTSGGGPGVKQGDIDPGQLAGPLTLDVHMSPQGNNMTCLDCHTARNHRIAGRGNDMRPTDLNARVDCLNCHSLTPHDTQNINKHTAKVHCTVCHIPAFGRGVRTEMTRDFTATELDTTVNRFEPVRTYANNVTPVYRWFNGLSYFFEFGRNVFFQPDGNLLIAGPLGAITDPNAKIHAFKDHRSKLGYELQGRRLLPVKSKILWETGDALAALRQGGIEVGYTFTDIGFANTKRYFSLYHEVAPKENALTCGACHVSTGLLNFQELGYQVRATRNGQPLCQSCHGRETASFLEVHREHVDERSISCITCHTFQSAPAVVGIGKIEGVLPLLLLDN
jgi:hypothetical protein